MATQFHLYGNIEKFDPADDGSLLVTGIASTEDVDAQGEVVTADAMRKAIPSYLQSGTVREMHQPSAAGKPVSAFVDDDGRTHFTAKVVDKSSIQKIKDGVLKGFSIGAKKLKSEGSRITELLLKDISLVDLPCNSQCVFEIIKFDKPEDKCNDPGCKNHSEGAVQKCSTCKGKIAKSEHDKSMSAELIQKIDTLSATVETLAKTVETISKAAPVPKFVTSDGKELSGDAIAKALSDINKMADDTRAQLATSQRNEIINKMDAGGRVAFNESGVAYTRKELDALPLEILKVLAVNAPTIPMQARAIFHGEQDPKSQLDPKLKGSDKTAALWEKQFPSLDVAKARFVRGGTSN